MANGRIRIDFTVEVQGKPVASTAGFSMAFNGNIPPAYDLKDNLEKVIVAFIRDFEESGKWPEFNGFEDDKEEEDNG